MSVLFSYRVRDVSIQGNPNYDPTSPAVVVANHQRMKDIALTANALQIVGMDRVPRFVAKKELWRFRPAGWLLEMVGAIKVDREDRSITAGRKLLAATEQTLIEDKLSLVIYPQGKRVNEQKNVDSSRLRKSAVLIAKRNEVPIVPMRIDYSPATDTLLPFRSDAQIVIKDPFFIEDVNDPYTRLANELGLD